MHSNPIAEALFSRTQQRVLGLLFCHPDNTFYLNEVVRAAGVGVGGVQRELARLEAAGLVTIRRRGNQKHYQANRASPVFAELHGIAIKTLGLTEVIQLALAPLAERILLAFVFGSVAAGTEHSLSDVDVMIVSADLSYSEVVAALMPAGESLAREINPVLYSPENFSHKLAADNHFLNTVIARPRIMLIGDTDDVGVFAKPGENRRPED